MIYYKEESFQIIGAAIKVYNTMGYGFLESIYQEALSIELRRNDIPFVQEKKMQVFYDGIPLMQTFKADFVCYDSIIIETKAVSALTNAHRAQLMNYLHVTGLKLGLLINFGSHPQLQWERIVN